MDESNNKACDLTGEEIPNFPYTNPATFANGEVQFPVCAMGLIYPHTWITPADALKRLHDCNFNINIVGEIGVGSLEKSLKNAIKERVKIFTWFVNFFTDENRLPKESYGVDVNIGPYGEGFAGINLCDEPDKDLLNGISDFKYGKTLKYLYENIKCVQDVKYPVYINLTASTPEGYSNYQDYLSDYQNIYKPSFFSYDLYPIVETVNLIYEGINLNPDQKDSRDSQDSEPFEGKIDVSDKFYEMFNIYRVFSLQKNRPFWAFCQGQSFMRIQKLAPKYYKPIALENFLRFEAFTALAYGAKGIVYWSYSCSETQERNESNIIALLNRRNEKTASWYYAQKVNAEIQKYKDIFLNAILEDVDKYYSYNNPDVSFYLRISIEVKKGKEIVVSRFKTSQYIYILIVSTDPTDYTEINIKYDPAFNNFTPPVELTPIKSKGNSNQSLNSGDNDRILIPGGYRIIRCINTIHGSMPQTD